MINLRNSLIGFGLVALIASCTNKSIPVQKETDDMYASSADAAISPVAALQKKNVPTYRSEQNAVPYDDQFDPIDIESEMEATDSYYSEDYITARDYKRKVSPNPGYGDGYADGYSQGWTDYAWSQPMGWNSPFNRFGTNNFFFNSWAPMRSGIFVSYSPWGWNTGWNSWGWNSGWNNWGWNSWNSFAFYDPFWGPSFYSPWNNWNSPWGYNSWAFNRWGMYDNWGYYGNSFNNYNRFYNNQSVLANRAYQTGQRTYGPRDNGGRNTSTYNDRFVNARRPAATMSGGRTASDVRNTQSTANANGQRVLSERRPGSNAGTASNRSIYEGGKPTQASDAYNPNSRRAGSYESYSRNNGSMRGSSPYSRSSGSSSNTYSRSSGSSSNYGSSRSYSSGYDGGRSSSGSYSSGRNSGSSSYGSGSTSRGNYSSGSSSSSRGSSGSSYSSGGGSSSRGSSGSSGGGSSRGNPR